MTDLRYIDDFQSEKDLIKSLSILKKENKINVTPFINLIYDPIQHEDFVNYHGFYLGFEILRENFGLEKGGIPGDVDILIIPYNSEKIYFERSCAIEVKVVRPTLKNPKKAPTSYGIKQIRGLIDDGFPLVGLIHICMPESFKEEERRTIKLIDPVLPIDSIKQTNYIKIDPFPVYSIRLQMKRLLSNKDLPKFVGISIVGLKAVDEGRLELYYDIEFNKKYSSGYFNPCSNSLIIQNIQDFFERNKENFISLEL